MACRGGVGQRPAGFCVGDNCYTIAILSLDFIRILQLKEFRIKMRRELLSSVCPAIY